MPERPAKLRRFSPVGKLVGFHLLLKTKKGEEPFTFMHGEWYNNENNLVEDPHLRSILDKNLPQKYRRLF